MDQAMANHLILPLEPLSAFSTRASWHGAIVWTGLRMHISVRIEKILGLERRSGTPLERATVAADLRVSDPIDAHAIRYGRHDSWRSNGVAGLESLAGGVADCILDGGAMHGRSIGGEVVRTGGGKGVGRWKAALVRLAGRDWVRCMAAG